MQHIRLVRVVRAVANQSRLFSIAPRRETTVPVTVLSGFLGAGKTTLVNHILRCNKHDKKVAVLVNDMADINIDSDLIRNAESGANAKSMVELENGCICCTLRDDLVIELANLARGGGLDHIIVESTGISEPLPVAQTFSTPITEIAAALPEDEQGKEKLQALTAATSGIKSLEGAAHLHSLVTVVDCATFLEHLHSIKNLHQLNMSAKPEDKRPLAQLLMEQVQFANTILLNKTDLVSAEECEKVKQLLKLLNPWAVLKLTTNSAIEVPTLLAERQYDESHFNKMPAWAEELAKGNAGHTPETEEYGISHFSLRVLGRPFHPKRWWDVVTDQKLMKGMLRAKGMFWTSAEPHTRIDYSLVGRTGNLIVNTVWAQAGIDMLRGDQFRLRKRKENAEKEAIAERAIERLQAVKGKLQAEGVWHPVTHDRRIELVFIGDENMDKASIEAAMEAALLTQEELHDFNQFGELSKADKTKLVGGQAPDRNTNPFANVPRCVLI